MSLIITWADVIARYGELNTLPSGTSPEVRENLMLNAEAEVHSRLASRFTVPFSSSNYTARSLAVDVLYVQTQTTRQPEKAKALMDSVNERIKALLAGESSMVDSAGATVLMVGDTVWSSSQNYPPVFGVSPIECAIVSSEQLYDEADSRGEYQ